MKRRVTRVLLTILLVAIFATGLLMAFAFGAVVGQFRPHLAKPYSDWAFAILLPLQHAYCDVEDVTTCGISDVDRPIRSCDPFTSDNPRNAILLTFGQSNSANFGGGHHTAGDNVVNFNLHDGKCYITQDPLQGTDGSGGSVWGILGDQLIASGAYDRVLVVPFGIGGTALREWTTGGRLHPRVEHAARRLALAGIEPTHVLWHQGENDARDGTPSEEYIEQFAALVESLRKYGVSAPVFPAVASICGNPGSDTIREAQRALPQRIEGVYPGPDTDSLSDMSDRFDYCHFSKAGLLKHAKLWTEVILSYEENKVK
jgi:hypothetical protein